MKPASAILTIGVYHPTDVGKTAINYLTTFRMIAQCRHTVADIASIFSRSDRPSHGAIYLLVSDADRYLCGVPLLPLIARDLLDALPFDLGQMVSGLAKVFGIGL